MLGLNSLNEFVLLGEMKLLSKSLIYLVSFSHFDPLVIFLLLIFGIKFLLFWVSECIWVFDLIGLHWPTFCFSVHLCVLVDLTLVFQIIRINFGCGLHLSSTKCIRILNIGYTAKIVRLERYMLSVIFVQKKLNVIY